MGCIDLGVVAILLLKYIYPIFIDFIHYRFILVMKPQATDDQQLGVFSYFIYFSKRNIPSKSSPS